MTSTTRQRIKYILADFIGLNIGWLLFNVVRYFFLPPEDGYVNIGSFLTDKIILVGQFVFPLMSICMYAISGFYNRVFFKSRVDELLNTVAVSFISMLVVYFVALINDNIPERLREYELMLILWAFLFVPVYVPRCIITTISTLKVIKRELAFNTLIIGTTMGAIKLANKLDNMPRAMGFNIIGYVDPDSKKETTAEGEDDEFGRRIFPMSHLSRICELYNVKNLIVIPHRNGMKETVDMIYKLYNLGVSIYITPELYHLLFTRARMQNVAGEPLINISEANISPMTLNLKRISDVVLSAVALVLLSPVFAAVAIAVKRDSKGSVFYSQERVGYHKRPFKIYKFRSMYMDAESHGPALSSTDDPRITPVGKFLRKYRLDELPQFWNVLKGDMSLVGPRPEREYYVRRIVLRAPYYSLLHQVRPGLTSWGMVKYGYASTVDEMLERLRYDLLYLDSVSLVVDLKIMFYTVNTILTGKGV